MDISPGLEVTGGGGDAVRIDHPETRASRAPEGNVAVIQRQVPPTDSLPAEDRARVLEARVNAVVEFNNAALRYVTRVGDVDARTGQSRWIVTILLAAALVVGSFAVAFALLLSPGDAWAATASAVIAIGILAVAGWLNPLQTIERDVVFRRWSDAIMAAFFLQAGDYDSTKSDLRDASRQASLDFAILAAAYGKETKQTTDTLARIIEAQTTPTPEADNLALTLTNPGNQLSTAGARIQTLAVQASGPMPLAFLGTLPAGITIGPETGEMDGIPEAAGTTQAEVVVSTEDGASVSAVFVWTVREPGAADPAQDS